MSAFFKNEIIEKNIAILQRRGFCYRTEYFLGSYQVPDYMTLLVDHGGVANLVVSNANGQKIPIHVIKDLQHQEKNLYHSDSLEDHDILIFMGFGLGYECIEILRRIDRKPRILILEPYQDIFQLAIRTVNLTEIFDYDRLDIFIGSEVDIEKIVELYKDKIPIGKIRIYTMPSYRLIYGKKFSAVEEKLKNHIRAIRDNWHTTKNNGKRILSNTIQNLPSLFAGFGLNVIKGQFRTNPALCIAAGPSLDSTLKYLKQIRSNFLIIACDSAVNALLDNGIKPQIVVTADIFDTNFEKIKNYVDQLRESLLVYGIESNPDNVRKYMAYHRIAVSSGSKLLLDWLSPWLDMDCRLPSLTSVSQMAVFTALALGADPVILVGMDLSYPEGKSHSAASAMQEDLNLKKLTRIAGISGIPVFSSPQLIADKVFLENAIADSNARFINTGMAGALIQGTENKSLAELLATELNKSANPEQKLSGIDWSPAISKTQAGAELSDMLQHVIEFIECCQQREKELSQFLREVHDGGLDAGQLSCRSGDIKLLFEEFKANYGLLFGIIEIAIGEEVHAILKKREHIAVKASIDPGPTDLDEVNVIQDYYRAYCSGAEFLHERLSAIEGQLARANSIEQSGNAQGTGDNAATYIELGRHYAKIDEIWQAERAYLNAIRRQPENPSPRIDLIQMFVGSELWQSARQQVETACQLFPDNNEVLDLNSAIENKIREIMEQIKAAWVAGEKEKTRRLLKGYLLLCPDDEQANLLKDVLREVDETLAAASQVVQEQNRCQTSFDELIANASRCIENLEFGNAIGIMEGLITNFPKQAMALRGKIGDIRMLQKDFPSAVWNYSQALKLAPRDREIQAKIINAKRQLNNAQPDHTLLQTHPP